MPRMIALFFLFATAWAQGASADPVHANSVVNDIAEGHVQKALERRLFERSEWRRLMHYKRGLFGGWTSEADGMAFFVAADGRTNPEAELAATIRGFFSNEERRPTDPTGIPQSVRCQFPARWNWLSKELGLQESDVPQNDCAKFKEFKTRIDAHSVTLIFSGYYVNNPSSAFGHTLLRLNRAANKSGPGSELLDYGINYAANPTTKNPLLYSLFGLTGVFKGTFSYMPYYYKVREYNDFDARDLWEYNLNLTQDEIDQLVAHIWEVGSTYFDYFYFTENCSYHMLTLLDAAAPRLNVTARTPYFVVPIDTVKAATAEPGLAGDVKLRPSIHSQLSTRLAGLSRAEVAHFQRLSKQMDFNPNDLKDIEPHAAAKILDALADAIDFTYSEQLINKESKVSAWKQKVLVTRSQLPMGESLKVHVATSARPDLSHDSSRVMIGGGRDRTGGEMLQAQFRFSLHDWLDPLDGYPPLSTVELGRVSVRYRESDKKFGLEQFRLMQVASISPITAFNRRMSWRVQAGADRITDQRCRNCVAGLVSFFSGGAFNLGKKTVVYGLFGPQISGSADFDNEIVPEAVATFGTRFVFSNRWLALAEGEWRRVFHGKPFETKRLELTTRWTPNLKDGVELQTSWHDGRPEAVLSYLRFF